MKLQANTALLIERIFEQVLLVSVLTKRLGLLDCLLVFEVMASLHRRIARDMAISKEEVEEIRRQASAIAERVYEGGPGPALRRTMRERGAATDEAFSAEEKERARADALDAISRAIGSRGRSEDN